jgi:hypothetical protein
MSTAGTSTQKSIGAERVPCDTDPVRHFEPQECLMIAARPGDAAQ